MIAADTITTVIAAAASYALTDIATVRDEFSINDTSADAFLNRAISQASKAIANYCNRVFPIEGVQDVIYMRRGHEPPRRTRVGWPLQLSRWPIAYPVPVTLTGNTHGTVTIDGLSSAAGLVAGELIFGAGIPQGDTIASVNSGAGSLQLKTAASASATGVSLTAGISVTEFDWSGTATSLVFGTDYVVDADTGELIRISANTGLPIEWTALQVTVQYSAGYAAIPDDIVDATLRLITARYRARGRDPMLMSDGEPGIGQQRYWVGVQPGQEGAFPPEIASLLDNYRVPVFA